MGQWNSPFVQLKCMYPYFASVYTPSSCAVSDFQSDALTANIINFSGILTHCSLLQIVYYNHQAMAATVLSLLSDRELGFQV